MERDEILKVYDAGPEAVVQLVTELIHGFTRIVEKQSEEIAQLKGRVITLEQQINKNSHNSSKPLLPTDSTNRIRKLARQRTTPSRRTEGTSRAHFEVYL